MVTWFAGLFYLPRLFVYHAMSTDQPSLDRFKVMERKLYFGIMTPGMIMTLVFGIWMLLWGHYEGLLWIKIKLVLIAILIIYHVHCGKLLLDFKHDRNTHSHVYYRWYNEIPVLFLFAIIFLAVLRP
jgi:putative membrane protein